MRCTTRSATRTTSGCWAGPASEEIAQMKALTHDVNAVLRPMFANAGIDLVDYKLEFGHAIERARRAAGAGRRVHARRLPAVGREDRREARQGPFPARSRRASSSTTAKSRSASARRCSEPSAATARKAGPKAGPCHIRREAGCYFFGRLPWPVPRRAPSQARRPGLPSAQRPEPPSGQRQRPSPARPASRRPRSARGPEPGSGQARRRAQRTAPARPASVGRRPSVQARRQRRGSATCSWFGSLA